MPTTILRLPPSPKVMFMGDSLTQGVGPAEQRYGGARAFVCLEFPTIQPYGNTYRDGAASPILQALGKDYSDGVGGSNIIDMDSRITAALAATGVTIDCVLIHAGSNGGGAPVGGTQLATYIATLYAKFMAHNPAGVLVVGCATGIGCGDSQNPGWDPAAWNPPFATASACWAASYALMATACASLPRCITVDCGSQFRSGSNVGGVCVNGDWGADYLHPLNSGYQKMAAGWCEGLRRLRVGMSQ